MVCWARKMVEMTQFLLHCYYHISEENASFEMIFCSRTASKKGEIWIYIFDATNEVEN